MYTVSTTQISPNWMFRFSFSVRLRSLEAIIIEGSLLVFVVQIVDGAFEVQTASLSELRQMVNVERIGTYHDTLSYLDPFGAHLCVLQPSIIL